MKPIPNQFVELLCEDLDSRGMLVENRRRAQGRYGARSGGQSYNPGGAKAARRAQNSKDVAAAREAEKAAALAAENKPETGLVVRDKPETGLAVRGETKPVLAKKPETGLVVREKPKVTIIPPKREKPPVPMKKPKPPTIEAEPRRPISGDEPWHDTSDPKNPEDGESGSGDSGSGDSGGGESDSGDSRKSRRNKNRRRVDSLPDRSDYKDKGSLWSRSLKFAMKDQGLDPAHRRRQAFSRVRDVDGRDNSGKLPNWDKRYPRSEEQVEAAKTTDYRDLKFGGEKPPDNRPPKPETVKTI